MSTQTFHLPDVGEGLTEAEIVQWHVAAGDDVAVNDVLVEIETAKSLVELPSPFSGTVGELLVGEGATVEVGAAIITIAGASGEADAASGNSAHGEKPDEKPSATAERGRCSRAAASPPSLPCAPRWASSPSRRSASSPATWASTWPR